MIEQKEKCFIINMIMKNIAAYRTIVSSQLLSSNAKV